MVFTRIRAKLVRVGIAALLAIAAAFVLPGAAAHASSPYIACTGGCNYLLGKGYADINYGGAEIDFYAGDNCNVPTTFTFNWMPNGFNDVLSSFKTYNNCGAWLYADDYRGGASCWIWGGWSDLRSCQNDPNNSSSRINLNDQTSSITFEANPYLG